MKGGHFIDGWVSGQSDVALSSAEAEFYALGKAVAGARALSVLAGAGDPDPLQADSTLE